MTHSWETIINEFLEGKAQRVDVESLRMRLDLDQDARDEIEAVLRLSDELSDAARSMPMIPSGASERLTEKLSAHITSSSGEMDESVVRRLTRQLQGQPPAIRRTSFPDVLAATIDDEKPEATKADEPTEPGEGH